MKKVFFFLECECVALKMIGLAHNSSLYIDSWVERGGGRLPQFDRHGRCSLQVAIVALARNRARSGTEDIC